MKLVDFANFKTWKVTDETLKNELLSKIKQCTSTTNASIFPGAHPVSIERVHLEALRKEPYWVCAKSDGIRYLFVCLTHENKSYSFFLNRRNDIFLINCNNEASVFKSTILDGEIIFNTRHTRFDFVIYDAVVVKGESVSQLHHSERLKKAFDAIKYITNKNGIVFDIKVFYPMKNIKHYVDNILPNIEHKTDGLIFTPECLPVTNGTHFKLFKWKSGKDNTVDFSIHRNIKSHTPKYILKILKGRYLNTIFDNLLHVDDALVEELDSYVMQDLNCIVECKYISDKNWKAVKIRKDKSYPNNFLTYTKTLLNIQEDIHVEEFFK